MLDVLDSEKTLFVKGTDHIIKPFFSLKKISNFAMFYCPQILWQIPSGLYVNEKIKIAVEKEKMKEICFEKTRVT